MEKEFVWNNELIMEFVNFHENQKDLHWLSEDIEAFKKLKEKDIPKVDWEIVAFVDHCCTMADGTKRIVDWKDYYTHCTYDEWFSSWYNQGFKIHSVKRLTDNTTWVVGETIGCVLNDIEFVIEKIELSGEPYLVGTHSYCPLVPLSNAKKITPKQLIYTTFDNISIYKGDNIPLYVVGDAFNRWDDNSKDCVFFPGFKYFASKEKRDDFILNNSPVAVTYKELHEFLRTNRLSGLIDFFKSKLHL